MALRRPGSSDPRYALLLLATLLPECAVYPQALQRNAEAPKPSISGTVTDETTGEPLRKAYLELMRNRTGSRDDSAQNPVAISDAEGHFSFRDLDPGDYSIDAQKVGYITGSVRDLHVDTTKNLADIRVRMVQLSTISVRVLDPDGDPVPFVSVGFYRLTFKDGKRRLVAFQSYSGDETDPTPSTLEPGRYYIAAEMRTSATRKLPVSYLPTWYPNSLDASSASPVDLAPGQNIRGLEIQLRAGTTYRIRGVVAGLPALEKGARPYFITARRQSTLADDPTRPSSQVSAKGTFELAGAIPGTYQLEVGRIDMSKGRYAHSRWGSATVQVGNEDLNNVTVESSAPRTVLLRFRVEGSQPVELPHLACGLLSTDGAYQSVARELDDGRYEVEGVGAGQRYTLNLWNTQGVNVYVKFIIAGGANFANRLIDVDQIGAEPLEVVLSTHGGTVRGTVNEGEGGSVKAEGKITVLLAPDRNDAATREQDAIEVTADTFGAFTIRNIPPGKYSLFAWHDLPDGAWKDGDFWRETKSEGTPITIAEDDKAQIALPLIAPGKTKALLDRLDIR